MKTPRSGPLRQFRPFRLFRLLAATSLVLATDGCGPSDASSGDPSGDEEATGTTSSALTQSLRLPFPPGHAWFICQSYVGFSHKSNRPFDIGWTKTSCNAGNNDTGGRTITAPAAGKISHLPNTLAGGDFMCLSLTGGGSIVFGHVKPEAGMKIGSSVAAGQKLATVRTSTDPAAQNAGIAHLHFEAFSGNSCYTGTAQAFTGAWRMACAPDLPYVATANFYNGTALTPCAPDAGAPDAGAGDAAADARDDASAANDGAPAAPGPDDPGAAPPSRSDLPPEGANDDRASSEDEAGDGCTIGRPTRIAHARDASGVAGKGAGEGTGAGERAGGWSFACLALVLAARARRRR